MDHPSITALRWVARFWAAASLLFVLAIVVGEFSSESTDMTASEVIGLLCFPVGVAFGLLIAFRYERAGGWVSVTSLLAFYVWHLVVAGRFPGGPWFALVAAPGAIYIVCSRLAQVRHLPAGKSPPGNVWK